MARLVMTVRARWSFARILIVIAATLVILALGATGFRFLLPLLSNDLPPDWEAAAQPYVERYIDLLNAGDEDGLRVHLANPSAPGDAARRIAAYRGLGLHDVHTTVWDSPEAGREVPWFVTIKARTSAGAIVTMHECIDWTDEPSPGASRWHLIMASLYTPTGSVSGTWRVKGSSDDGLMRVRWTWKKGKSRLRVTHARFFDAPRQFVLADSDRISSNAYVRVIRYVSEPTSSRPDVILFDHLADTITITGGRSGTTAALVRVSQ
jgi:hypothetical protein